MDCTELRQILEDEGVSPRAYNIGGGWTLDCQHVLEETPGGWTVYFFERGIKGAVADFATEAAACAELRHRLARYPRNPAR